MAKDKTAVIAEAMFAGDKLYQVRARQALPLLVRQAFAQAPVYYEGLAEELGMPNARNLNFVLGSVGTTLQQLGQKKKSEIPPIQSLVIGQGSGLPGKGFFEGFTGLQSPTRQQRQALLNEYHAKIYAYPLWLNILAELGLPQPTSDAMKIVEKARTMQGGGEGEAHRTLKDRIYENPSLVGGPAKPTMREREFRLPSGDCIDVYFGLGSKQLAVEVKPSTSAADDIARGLFQCVKYETILTKWRAWQGTQVDVRVVLALGGPFPGSLLGLRNSLDVDVIDQLDGK
jgi:hypothetical protein